MSLPNNQQVSLRDALELVPVFDGKNIPVVSFIEGCHEAKLMLPDSSQVEENLVKLIRGKLIGEVRKSISGNIFKTILELEAHLKKIYLPNKSIYQLQGELGNIFMKENESVISYANRVKELSDQIFDSYRLSSKDGKLSKTMLETLEVDIMTCFRRGLRPELEIRIPDCITLKETTNKALEAERKLNAVVELRKENSCRPNNAKITFASADIVVCQNCNVEGHTSRTCRRSEKNQYSSQHRYQRSVFRMKQRPPVYYLRRGMSPSFSEQKHSPLQLRFSGFPQNLHNKTNSQFPNKNDFRTNQQNRFFNVTCKYCKNRGHVIKNCRKREYNNYNQGQQYRSSTLMNQGNE